MMCFILFFIQPNYLELQVKWQPSKTQNVISQLCFKVHNEPHEPHQLVASQLKSKDLVQASTAQPCAREWHYGRGAHLHDHRLKGVGRGPASHQSMPLTDVIVVGTRFSTLRISERARDPGDQNGTGRV